MSMENPLWGASRIHGELLKLGFEIAQSSVAKYMVKTTAATQPGMADILAQPRAGGCRHGPVRCSKDRVRPAPWLRHRPAGPQRSRLDQCHSKSDGRMGGT